MMPSLARTGGHLLERTMITSKMELENDTLQRLNQEYINAFMSADVKWYDEHLADDFVCIESNGTVLDKGQFLINVRIGPDVVDYKLEKVNVRIYGIVALVQATGLFTRKDQSKGLSRYTDIYVQTDQGWKVVSAQITRTSRLEY